MLYYRYIIKLAFLCLLRWAAIKMPNRYINAINTYVQSNNVFFEFFGLIGIFVCSFWRFRIVRALLWGHFCVDFMFC